MFEVILNTPLSYSNADNPEEKMNFSIKDLFSKCDQIRRKFYFLYNAIYLKLHNP